MSHGVVVLEKHDANMLHEDVGTAVFKTYTVHVMTSWRGVSL
jgi:hypothetical protein